MGFVKLYHVYTCRIYFIVISRNFIGSIKLAKLILPSFITYSEEYSHLNCICLVTEACALGIVRLLGITVLPESFESCFLIS